MADRIRPRLDGQLRAGVALLVRAFVAASVAAFVAFWVTGCAVGGKLQTLDDGSYKVDCSGGYHDWTACNEAARRACRGGAVEILSQVSNEASQNVGSRDWSAGGSEVSRSMNFRCR
jgi:hypothetical protein